MDVTEDAKVQAPPTQPVGERVLIVEDDPATRDGLAELVQTWGFQTDEASDGEEGLRKVTSFRPAIIVSDLVMPRMGGMDLLRALKDQLSDLTFILLTAQGTVESAVEAIKDGAYDYLSKPVDPQRLRILLQKAVERQETLREVRHLRRQLREQGSFGRIVGNSPSIRSVYRVIEQAAPTAASVLIWGESGTGKELVAQTIHELSPRVVVPVRGDQLRGDSRDAARERDLRPREGRVHRRARSPDRRVRAGASRHAVPRRDRRDAAGDAGQAAARAAGADLPPARRPAGADRSTSASSPRPTSNPTEAVRRPASCARTSTTG